MPDWWPIVETILALVGASILGGLVGLDREAKNRAAGLRTHMMVSLGAALFVLAGGSMTGTAPADLTRVIQGVAAGIGFIGAGTILKLTEKLEVRGLTTASSIWAAAAVGTAVGLRQYLLAVAGTVLAFLILTALYGAEQLIEKTWPGAVKSDADPDPPAKAKKMK